MLAAQDPRDRRAEAAAEVHPTGIHGDTRRGRDFRVKRSMVSWFFAVNTAVDDAPSIGRKISGWKRDARGKIVFVAMVLQDRASFLFMEFMPHADAGLLIFRLRFSAGTRGGIERDV